jgi:hypothetical protein
MRRLTTLLSIVPLLMAIAMPAGAQSPTTTDELLAGMVTEEVEPGVFRVVNDGVRDLAKANDFDIVAGHDGGIWLLRRGRFFRLGSDDWLAWPTETPKHAAFEVASDGTVWVGAHEGLQSFDGRDWTVHDGHDWRSLEIAPDGTVWSTWVAEDQRRQVFGYLDADGWQGVGETDVYVVTLRVASPDDIWGMVPTWVFPFVVRFVDGAWQRLVGVEGTEATWQPAMEPASEANEAFHDVALGPDGTAWLPSWDRATDGDVLIRFDGDEWSRWPIPDTEALRPPLAVSPDGSLWFASGFPPDGCQGVRRFDGVTWDGFLTDLCVGALDITSDGAVWLLATEPGAGLLSPYVITPQATAWPSDDGTAVEG